jgi:hypothetical protein
LLANIAYLLNLGQLNGRERSLQEEDMYQISNVSKQSAGRLVQIVIHQQEHILIAV